MTDLDAALKLFEEGRLLEALKDLLIIEQSEDLDGGERFPLFLLKSRILVRLGRSSEACNVARQLLSMIDKQEKKSPFLPIDTRLVHVEACLDLGQLEESLREINLAEREIFNLRANQLTEASKRMAALQYYKGSICWRKSDLDRALEHFEESLAIREDIGDKLEAIASLTSIGNIYRDKGELNLALKYYNRCLTINEEIRNKQSNVVVLSNIAEIYRQKGDLDLAIEYHRKSLTGKVEIGNRFDIAESMLSIGYLEYESCEWDYAIAHLEQGLELVERTGNSLFRSKALFLLIITSISMENLGSAEYYLDQLQLVNEREDNPIIRQRHSLARALVMKARGGKETSDTTAKILDQIVKEDVIDHELTIQAVISLYDLYLGELMEKIDEELFERVGDLTWQFLDIAQEKTSFSLLVEAYLLQAKLSIVENDYYNARVMLIQAQILAAEKGLQLLVKKIKQEQNSLYRKLHEETGNTEQELQLDRATELEWLENAIFTPEQEEPGKKPWSTEEEPILVAVQAKSGIILFSRTLDSHFAISEKVISGFLTASNVFCEETFSRPLDTIKIAEYNLLTRTEEPFVVVYVARGMFKSAHRTLEQFTRLLRTLSPTWETMVGLDSNWKPVFINTAALITLERLIDWFFY